MSAVTRMTQSAVSAYAPSSTHLSEVTVEAVEKIGNATAEQIEMAADEIEANGKALAADLRKTAAAMRERTRSVTQQVSDFCLRTTSARTTVLSLETEITGGISRLDHDNEPSPAFLHRPL